MLDILRQTQYIFRMIKSFSCKDTEKLFDDNRVRRFHALEGDRKGQYAISIDKQWRLFFTWHEDNAYDAYDIEIVDYH